MKSDDFLSSITGLKYGIVDFDIENNIDNLKNFDFAYAKTKASTSNAILAKKHNFYLADITVSLNYEVPKDYATCFENNEVLIASQLDEPALIKLAKDNFIYDRFHSDPNICDLVASNIKAKWIENYFNGTRGDKCFVYLCDQNVSGFLLTVIRKNVVVIDLFAVDKKYRNRNIGKKLIEGMLRYYKNKYQSFSVVTQLKNEASIHIYKKCGFNICEYGLVWHYFSNT